MQRSFTYVDIGDFGHHNDAGVFNNSDLGKSLADGSFGIPPATILPGCNTMLNHFIVGDAAFPLKPYLMKPYPGTCVPHAEAVFNYRYIYVLHFLHIA